LLNRSFTRKRPLRFLVRLVKSSANKLGVSLSSYPQENSLARRLRDYISSMQINCILDAGAFVGTYAKELRRLGFKGRIISFEPVPSSYALLKQNMRDDTAWTGVQVGLSDVSRMTSINTYKMGQFNSLLNLKEDSGRAYGVDVFQKNEVEIRLRRLDEILLELLAQAGISSPRIFLKMDTQGHDLNVLRGSSKVSQYIVGLQSELPAVQLYEGMTSMAAALDYYGSWGFVPIGFFPVNNTFDARQIIPEFDVLFNRFEGSLESRSETSADKLGL
jgi:FkbM family methyltransferase